MPQEIVVPVISVKHRKDKVSRTETKTRPVSVQVLGTGPMPEPRRVDVERLAAGEDFGSWVRVEGRVVDVCMVASTAILEVAGVCVRDAGELGGPTLARLHLRAAADVVVRRNPFPWDSLPPGRILAVSAALGAIALVWITLLRRQVSQRRHAEDKARREAEERIAAAKEREDAVREREVEVDETLADVERREAEIERNLGSLKRQAALGVGKRIS